MSHEQEPKEVLSIRRIRGRIFSKEVVGEPVIDSSGLIKTPVIINMVDTDGMPFVLPGGDVTLLEEQE